MSTKHQKPTGKVAQTITAMKNIAKRLTTGKAVEAKKQSIKKSMPDKKPSPKPTKQKSTSKKTAISKPVAAKSSKPAPKKTSVPEKKTSPAKHSEPKSPVFCVHDLKLNQFVPVKGAKAISIPGFDGIQLFLHKGTNDYRISEASSGGLVATGNRQAVAVRMATETLNNHGKPKVLESIQKSIDRMGVVPGFTPPEGVKASDKPRAEPKEIFSVTTDDGKAVEVTYTPGFMKHLEFRGEISPTGYHSSFDYAGKTDVKEAARVKANELRVAFLKEQARQERKAKKTAAAPAPSAVPAVSPEPKQPAKAPESAGESTVVKSSGGNRGGKSKGKMSLLDAAAAILKSSNEPLCCKDITRLIFEQKLAESGGLTPHATLSAAMGREISAKGKESRFKRAERGLFASNL